MQRWARLARNDKHTGHWEGQCPFHGYRFGSVEQRKPCSGPTHEAQSPGVPKGHTCNGYLQQEQASQKVVDRWTPSRYNKHIATRSSQCSTTPCPCAKHTRIIATGHLSKALPRWPGRLSTPWLSTWAGTATWRPCNEPLRARQGRSRRWQAQCQPVPGVQCQVGPIQHGLQLQRCPGRMAVQMNSFALAATRIRARFYRRFPSVSTTRYDLTTIKDRWYARGTAMHVRKRLGKLH